MAYNQPVLSGLSTLISLGFGGSTPRRKSVTRGEVGAVSLGLVPAIVISLLIARYAVNVPYWDNWIMYVVPWTKGDDLASCWPLFAGHRMLLPCLFELELAHLSSMNALMWVFVKLPLFIAIYFVVYIIYRRRATTRRFYLLAIPFGLLVFSMAYWPMWIDPRPIFSQLAMLAFLVGLWVLINSPVGWKALGIAGLMAYVSSLSFFSGNITWLALGFVLWFRGYRDRRFILAWAGMALTVLLPYIYDYLQPAALEHAVPIPNLIDPFLFSLVLLGSPFTPRIDLSMVGVAAILGAIGLAITISYMIRILRESRAGIERALPWLVIMLWISVNALFMGFGRVGHSGLQGALSPRYESFGAVFWIAVICLIVIYWTRHEAKDRPGFRSAWMEPSAISVMIAGMFLYTTIAPFQQDRLDDLSVELMTGRDCLIRYQVADDRCLQILYWDASLIRQLMDKATLGRVSFLEGQATLFGMQKVLFLEPVVLENAPHPIDEQIRFQRATITADRPEETEVQFRKIRDAYYQILYQHPPSELRWPLDLTGHTRVLLRTGYFVDTPVDPEFSPSDGVLFEISVSDEGKVAPMFQKLVMPTSFEEGFNPVEIDLSSYAGRVVDLIMSTYAGRTEAATLNYDWAYWHYPELILDRLGE